MARQSLTVVDAPLVGVRVLDFGRYIAGPFAGALLADFGADVIRVERREGGEDRFLYPVTPQGDGAMFLQMNRNKRGMTLDLRAPDGREVLQRLIGTADVVVANLPPDTLRDLGIDYDSLCAIRADIVLAATSAFGAVGPYAAKTGFDGIGQAMSGAAYLSGEGEGPTKAFASWVDFTTGLFSAYGVMGALMVRARTGQGQEVQANLLASALTVMNFVAIEEALTGIGRRRTGNRAQAGGPADFFPTRDGWITVQVLGGPLFRRWAKMLGEPHWLEDPRFATDDLRARNGVLLSERTAAWCAPLTNAEALAAMEKARVPGGPVLSPAEVLRDPHVVQAGMLKPMDYPGAPAPAPVMLAAATLTRTPARLRRSAPRLGEHTDEILSEIGFGAQEIARLRAAGAI